MIRYQLSGISYQFQTEHTGASYRSLYPAPRGKTTSHTSPVLTRISRPRPPSPCLVSHLPFRMARIESSLSQFIIHNSSFIIQKTGPRRTQCIQPQTCNLKRIPYLLAWRSESTIMVTSCSKLTSGFQPSFVAALAGSPTSKSTSAGR